MCFIDGRVPAVKLGLLIPDKNFTKLKLQKLPLILSLSSLVHDCMFGSPPWRTISLYVPEYQPYWAK